MPGQRIIVCGSRTWADEAAIRERLHGLPPESTIVHGNAPGADRMAAKVAHVLGLEVERHDAQWGTYGKQAGIIRNREMAALGADACFAFWDGVSRGTAHMIREARQRGIPTHVIRGHDG